MSHFFTVVLVPSDTKNIERKVSKLLEPFNEELEVPEYDHECYCINNIARRYGNKIADETVNSIESLRNKYWAMPEDSRPEWKEHISKWVTIQEKEEKGHPMFGKPNPECEECKGTGLYKSTYNPNSKWDWWRIGGRWDGIIKNNPQESENGFNFDSKHETLGNNMILVKDIKEDNIPFAIVTPEGEWIEHGKMGWWGIVTDEKDKDNWKEIVKRVFEKYSDCIAVGCDLHI